MKSRLIFLSILFTLTGFICSADAQTGDNIIKSLQKQVPGEGKVNIYQDPSIGALIGSKRSVSSSGEPITVKTYGYRVQVYAGRSRNDANAMAAKVKELFPDLKIYTSLISPRWVCRIGDFRSIEEADAMMRQIKSSNAFREVSIVREQVIITI